MHYSIDFISIIFAAYINKNPITLLNPNCSDEEKNHVLKSSKSKIILSDNELKPNGKKIILNSQEIFFKKIKIQDVKIFNSKDRFIIFTSGTTNKPKGAILTTSSFSNNILSICENLKLKSFDKTLIFSPPAYAMGISQIFSFMYSNAKISFYNSGLKFPGELVKNIKRSNITRLNISVSAFRIFNKYVDKRSKFKSIKTIMSGGMPLTKEIFYNYKKLFKRAEIINFYGCTENSPRISHYKTRTWKTKEEYLPVGKPLKNVDLKILKKNKADKLGEILISGSSLMRGYLINNKISKKLYHRKWFNTGDLGFLDKFKNLHLRGRSDNIFSVGHEKLYPEDIEIILKKIFNFREVIVTKKKHNILNWIPVALIDNGIQKKINIENFSKKCKMYISSFKVPKKIIYTNKIPRNNYGKVDRKQIEIFINEVE